VTGNRKRIRGYVRHGGYGLFLFPILHRGSCVFGIICLGKIGFSSKIERMSDTEAYKYSLAKILSEVMDILEII
jgi:hypothetical protein